MTLCVHGIPAHGAELLQLVDAFRGLGVWVYGDLMLDEYVEGCVERISPEAPVPVVRVTHEHHRLGGAANVALQTATLDTRTSLLGLVGADEAGAVVRSLCKAAKIDITGVVTAQERCTTRKLRVCGESQQVVRVDREITAPCSRRVEQELISAARRLPRPDVVIVSDYAKGAVSRAVLDEILRMFAGAVPVVVDPKRSDVSHYAGSHILVPNFNELQLAAGRTIAANDVEQIAAAARKLVAELDLGAMVVKRAGQGMLVVPAKGPCTVIPGLRRPTVDATGAGDTAVALLGLGVGASASTERAAQVANVGAAFSTGYRGAVAIEETMLRHALAGHDSSKLLSPESLEETARAWQAKRRRVVLANGCFDLLHSGHLSLLESAARLGDILLVAINSDASVRRLKGSGRPILSDVERAAALARLSCVDAVTIFDSDSPVETVRRVRPKVLVKGEDYLGKQVLGREDVESCGGRVVFLPMVPSYSTTSMIQRIREREAMLPDAVGATGYEAPGNDVLAL